MKNPHGVEPTRYMKKKDSKCAILCNPEYGPIFGHNSDILINKHYDVRNICWVQKEEDRSYEYHPEYKSSLYVNTNSPDRTNFFTLLDYEVYTHNE